MEEKKGHHRIKTAVPRTNEILDTALGGGTYLRGVASEVGLRTYFLV
jgi:hypothetical protein